VFHWALANHEASQNTEVAPKSSGGEFEISIGAIIGPLMPPSLSDFWTTFRTASAVSRKPQFLLAREQVGEKAFDPARRSYVHGIWCDHIARKASTKQRLEQLIENDTAIVTLIKGMLLTSRWQRSRLSPTSNTRDAIVCSGRWSFVIIPFDPKRPVTAGDSRLSNLRDTHRLAGEETSLVLS
jgi:hypothetical protein